MPGGPRGAKAQRLCCNVRPTLSRPVAILGGTVNLADQTIQLERFVRGGAARRVMRLPSRLSQFVASSVALPQSVTDMACEARTLHAELTL